MLEDEVEEDSELMNEIFSGNKGKALFLGASITGAMIGVVAGNILNPYMPKIVEGLGSALNYIGYFVN